MISAVESNSETGVLKVYDVDTGDCVFDENLACTGGEFIDLSGAIIWVIRHFETKAAKKRKADLKNALKSLYESY